MQGGETNLTPADAPNERFALVPTGRSAREAHILEVATTIDGADRLELLLSVSRCSMRLIAAEPDLAGMIRVMNAGASLRTDRVQLSNGFNVIDSPEWRGQGIGTFAVSRMIAWAQHWHPQAEVWPLKLQRYGVPILASDRRIAFYRRFGFRREMADQEETAGSWPSTTLTVSELRRASHLRTSASFR